jgi:peptidoglycan/xylan/chitin deacetylase (PgdA/CDA1 family)
MNAGNHFILMYHHVGDASQLDALRPYVVTPRAFCAQMDIIEARQLKVVTLRELVADRGSEPRIVLTFDDCPGNLLDVAVPELERRGWKATFFAVAGKVGKYNDWDRMSDAPRVSLMGWDDLRSLNRLGHEIGAHGMTHTDLRECDAQAVEEELRASRNTLENGLGSSVATMAYPFGHAPDGYRIACPAAGFAAACSIFSTARNAKTDPYLIRRILVTERDRGIRMRAKLSTPYLAARHRLVDPSRLKPGETRPQPYRQ